MIYYLDPSPYKAATMLCDEHLKETVSKMLFMLQRAVIYNNGYSFMHGIGSRKDRDNINDSQARWCATHILNYTWACRYTFGASLEYLRRFGASDPLDDKIVDAYVAIRHFGEGASPIMSAEGTHSLWKFLPAEESAFRENTRRKPEQAKAWRRYYEHLSNNMSMKWTNRSMPDFLVPF